MGLFQVIHRTLRVKEIYICLLFNPKAEQ